MLNRLREFWCWLRGGHEYFDFNHSDDTCFWCDHRRRGAKEAVPPPSPMEELSKEHPEWFGPRKRSAHWRP